MYAFDLILLYSDLLCWIFLAREPQDEKPLFLQNNVYFQRRTHLLSFNARQYSGAHFVYSNLYDLHCVYFKCDLVFVFDLLSIILCEWVHLFWNMAQNDTTILVNKNNIVNIEFYYSLLSCFKFLVFYFL